MKTLVVKISQVLSSRNLIGRINIAGPIIILNIIHHDQLLPELSIFCFEHFDNIFQVFDFG